MAASELLRKFLMNFIDEYTCNWKLGMLYYLSMLAVIQIQDTPT